MHIGESCIHTSIPHMLHVVLLVLCIVYRQHTDTRACKCARTTRALTNEIAEKGEGGREMSCYQA